MKRAEHETWKVVITVIHETKLMLSFHRALLTLVLLIEVDSCLKAQSAGKLDIKHALSDQDIVGTARYHPLLLHNIPCAEISAGKRESDTALLARLQRFLLEAAELPVRPTRNVNIQLRNLGGGNRSGVLDLRSDSRQLLPQAGVAALSLACAASTIP